MSIAHPPEFARVPMYASEAFTTVADERQVVLLANIQALALHGSVRDLPGVSQDINSQYYVGWKRTQWRQFQVTYNPSVGITRLAKQAPYGHEWLNQTEELAFHQNDAEGLEFYSSQHIPVAWRASQSLFDGAMRRIELSKSGADTRGQPDLESMYLEAESRDHANRRLNSLLTEFTETMPSLRVQRMRYAARQLGKSVIHSLDFTYAYPL